MKALSIKQPWAWAIIRQGKDIENRRWNTKHRGSFYVHASKSIDRSAPLDLLCNFDKAKNMGDQCTKTGGIIGVVDLIDCVDHHDSKWFQGPKGFVLKDPVAIPFKELQGKLNFFEVE